MSKKYELTDETMIIGEATVLRRIRALKDFADVNKGDLGGWVQSEENLSHDGNCWVCGDAVVYGNARVYDDAQVFDNTHVLDDAQVYDNAWVHEAAVVFGNAKVYGYARVFGNARVYGHALVCDYARVHEDAHVFGNVQVYGDARVYGNALVHGAVQIFRNARVWGNARVYDDVSIYDSAWVYGNAKVYGDAHICENARVYGYARICSETLIDGDVKTHEHVCITATSDYFVVGPIGSRDDFTTFYRSEKGITVTCGCFKGSLEEFEKEVKATHGNNMYAKQYLHTIKYARNLLSIKKPDDE